MTIKESKEILDTVAKVLEVVKDGNPKQYYINNKGLARLGRLLNYTEGKDDIKEEIKQLLKDQYPNTYSNILDSLRKYHFTSFYTPKELIEYQIQLLKDSNVQPKRILEPSAGNGAYVNELSNAFPDAEIIALEPDILSYNILMANTDHKDNVTAINTTFEEYYLKYMEEEKQKQPFDLVISNIPFTDFEIKDRFLYEDYLITGSHKTVNNFMNVNHLDLLADGGLSMIITSNNFMDKNSYRDLRKHNMNKADLVQAMRFDNTLFKDEKTEVVSDLIIYQKNENKVELTTKEKAFIASKPLTIDGNEFQISAYFDAYIGRVQGQRSFGMFHGRPSITYLPLENPQVDFYQENKVYFDNYATNNQLAQNFNAADLSINSQEAALTQQTNSPDLSIEQIDANAKESISEAIEYDEYEMSEEDVTSEERPMLISLDDEQYLRNNSLYFSPGYRFINNVPSYYTFREENAKPVNKSSALIAADYISLKSKYILFRENSKRGLFTSEEYDSAKAALLDELATFSFKYDSLYSAYTVAHKIDNDSMYEEVALQLEKYELNKIALNELDVNFSINRDKKTLVIERPNRTAPKPTKSDESVKPTTPKENKEQSDTEPVREIKPETTETRSLEDLQKLSVSELAINSYDTTGNIDVPALALIKGISPKEFLEQGLEDNTFFLNPVFDDYNDGRFTGYKTQLIHNVKSGNIGKKIDAYEKHDLPFELNPNKIINEMALVKPKHINVKEIEFNFESPFIPRDAKIAFFKEKVGEVITFNVLQFASRIKLNFSLKHNSTADTLYSVKIKDSTKMSYKDILNAFANQKYPTVTYTVKFADGTSKTFVDKEATTLAHQKYETIQAEFKTFIMNDVRYKEKIESNYYETFLAERNYTTTADVLTFPETLEHNPYQHQRNAVLHGLESGTALYDHKVGHGKTATMGMLSHKLLQHKKSERIFITTLKSVSAQVYSEIKKNFPNKKMFLLKSQMLAPKKLEQTLQFLQDNKDIEIIVGNHEHMQKIPKDIEVVKSVLGRKIDLIEADLETAKQYGLKESKRAVESLIKKKESYGNKLKEAVVKQQKLSGNIKNITLTTLGIDTLIIDESHNFKNIGYTTRHSNVSGLNKSDDSNKGLDLEITIESIHRKREAEKGIFFFTGTPIINSVTEVYAILRQLTPRKMEKMDILSFDQFASVFLKQDVQLETDILGNPATKARFRYFTNMPELSKLYNSVSHISDDRTFRTNDIVVKESFESIEPTENILKLRDLSMDFIKSKDQSWLTAHYDQKQLKAAMVVALTINRNALADPMTVNEKLKTMQFTEKDQVKLKHLMKDAYNNYKHTDEHKGVTLIFSNMGVPNGKKDYDTYNSIKDQLVSIYNIPAEEIGIVHEANTAKKLAKFQADIREGKIRIAIGSTEKLGTGTNIQKRVSAILHLDIPYSPKDYDQRNGRGERAGNWIMTLPKYNKELIIKYYGVKETSDIFSFGLNKHKQLFRDQIKYNTGERIYDASLAGDPDDLSYDLMQAALMGDVESFELNMVEAQLKKLMSEKAIADMSRNESTGRIERAQSAIRELHQTIGAVTKQYEYIKDYIPVITEDYTVQQTRDKTLAAYKHMSPNTYGHIDSFEQLSQHLQYKLDIGFSRADFAILDKLYMNKEKPHEASHIVARREFNHINEKYRYEIGFSMGSYGLYGKKQYTFAADTLPYQLFRAVKNSYQDLNMLRREIRQHEGSIELNTELGKQQYPQVKLDKIKELEIKKSEIETIIKNKDKGKSL